MTWRQPGSLRKRGHRIINTASDWYYVLGRRTGDGGNQDFTSDRTAAGIARVAKSEVPGGADSEPAGEMLCVWCDEPMAPYTAEERDILDRLIGLF